MSRRADVLWVAGEVLEHKVFQLGALLVLEKVALQIQLPNKALMMDFNLVPLRFPGEQLRICDRGLTCCTTDMEHKLSTHSRAEFDRLLRDTIGQVRATFAAQAQRFDGKVLSCSFFPSVLQ
ncbi:hypothetical protein AVEN_202297-1 [Araneus ventricosus]|uniref:Uncharacterized protein n=1 Tax=Araneus ventricosus TaxID=182803 RepID=A0A4Y2I2D1_ARAVE|nr:hypothetical protein AVEN_202297-1 [Araneus ventricosus]